MPLTAKGEEIKSALTKEYGEKKGEQVLYAGKNKGTFSGIDSAKLARIADGVDRLVARFDAMSERGDAEKSLEQKQKDLKAMQEELPKKRGVEAAAIRRIIARYKEEISNLEKK